MYWDILKWTFLSSCIYMQTYMQAYTRTTYMQTYMQLYKDRNGVRRTHKSMHQFAASFLCRFLDSDTSPSIGTQRHCLPHPMQGKASLDERCTAQPTARFLLVERYLFMVALCCVDSYYLLMLGNCCDCIWLMIVLHLIIVLPCCFDGSTGVVMVIMVV